MKGRGGGGGGGAGGWRKRRDEAEKLPPNEGEEELVTSVSGGGGAGEEVMEGGGGGGVEEEDEEEEEMEDEDGYEEEEEGGGGGEEGGVVEERPKLDEGFYEIEDVRRKRVRKGEIQYLIKWRGWPETSNTWEPIENLQACSDVIEAFEESLRSGKHRLSRRRKRKYGVTNTTPRKKQRCTTSNLSASKVGLHSDGHFSSASVDNSSLSAPLPSVGGGFEVSKVIKSRDHVDDEAKNNEDANNSESTAQKTENGSSTYNSQQDEQNNGGTEREQNFNELKETTSIGNLNSEKFLVHCSDTRTSDKDGLRDGFSKAECAEPIQNIGLTGAKRRKSGSVRRFKQDRASLEVEEPHNSIQRNTTKFTDKFETRGVEDGNSMGDGAGDKKKLDGLINPAAITKIIKPISYSASISSSVQDVCVTFMAMRSDGSEVVVDNKFLKANNPLLLISFYEEHLRYSPPA